MLLDLQRIERKHGEGVVSRFLRLGQQMAYLICYLLELDGMKRGERLLQCSDATLRELLAAAIDNALPTVAREACELRLQCDGDFHINIDAARIRQVLNNLVNNAAKFSPARRARTANSPSPCGSSNTSRRTVVINS